ncbi:MAG TPA: hypothetical protein VFG47_17360 [Geminicoccaceae bacterium]|nr:hypothetical protein [Geminicoccaceae bacterium]
MRHLALILAAAAFTLGTYAAAEACDMHTAHTKTKEQVASAGGGASTPVVVPQPKSGS